MRKLSRDLSGALKHTLHSVDKILERADLIAYGLIEILSLLKFRPENWIDHKPFFGRLFIFTDSDGALKIYDDEPGIEYSITGLDIIPTLCFIHRLSELLDWGVLDFVDYLSTPLEF
jgi:hypothetical protein